MSKKCKGTGKAKGHGCGKTLPYNERNGIKSYKSKYGLGLDCCYTKWLISDDPNAKEQFDKLLITNERKFKAEKKKAWNIEKEKLKNDLEKKSSVEEKLQKPINKIARLLDKGHLCLSSKKPLGNNISLYDGGHLTSVKANPTLRFNLFNIYGQNIHDNQFLGGNEFEYIVGLEETFGREFRDFVIGLRKCEPLHLSKKELRDKISIALSLVKWLTLQDRTYTLEERISIRSDMNNALGIYPQEYCEFKNKNQ